MENQEFNEGEHQANDLYLSPLYLELKKRMEEKQEETQKILSDSL